MTNKLTGSFIARDANGNRYHVNVFTDYVSGGRELDGTIQEIEGMKSLKLQDGTHVNRIEQGKYRTVGLVEAELTSDDPGAP